MCLKYLNVPVFVILPTISFTASKGVARRARGNCTPLFYLCEAPLAVRLSRPSAPEGHGAAGASPEEGHEVDQRAGTPVLQKKG